ncbi:MAG: Uma2 family endonuclease [Desulfobacterales bacterium]|nr:Uma2 family endonuclease [Desulfobacterales bacterium]
MEEILESRRNSLPVNILHETGTLFCEDDDIFYPDEDGKPMAESDFQRNPLVYCVEALRAYFESEPDVYVSGDLLIYYEPGIPAKSVAPDVFVVFGIPKHDRRIYKIWKEGKSPDVVIEIASENTWKKHIENIDLYRRLKVGEYFIYDPEDRYFDPVLQGYRLDKKSIYQRIHSANLPDGCWKMNSRFLGLELRIESGRLRLYDPVKQEYLLTYSEEKSARLLAEQRAYQAKQQAYKAKQRTEQADQPEEHMRKIAENLLLMDVITIKQIAAATGLSEQQIQNLQKSQGLL